MPRIVRRKAITHKNKGIGLFRLKWTIPPETVSCNLYHSTEKEDLIEVRSRIGYSRKLRLF